MGTVTLPVVAALAVLGLLSDTVRAVIASVFRRPNRTSLLVRGPDGKYQSVELDRRDSGLSQEELASVIAQIPSGRNAKSRGEGRDGPSVS